MFTDRTLHRQSSCVAADQKNDMHVAERRDERKMPAEITRVRYGITHGTDNETRCPQALAQPLQVPVQTASLEMRSMNVRRVETKWPSQSGQALSETNPIAEHEQSEPDDRGMTIGESTVSAPLQAGQAVSLQP